MNNGASPGWWRQASLVLVLLAGAILVIYWQFDEPLRRFFSGAKAGVTLQGERVEGMFRAEVAALVGRIAQTQGRLPVDAVVDGQGKSIIPELNGIEIDQAATVELVMRSQRGAQLMPVYRELVPALCWEHYPFLPAYEGCARKPQVALMINVARGEEYLPAMLAVLEKEGAGATFFLTGSWAGENVELVRRISAGGYELGNHGYSDAEVLPELDGWAIARSLSRTNEIINDAAGGYPVYFTPHKGEFSDLALEIVSRQGMRTVLWSLDTAGWQNPGAAAMRARVMQNLAPGRIILIHPTADTAAFLEETIPSIVDKGLEIVSIGELLNPRWLPGAGEVAR
jgi:peptidoglycan-N-acetylglucosamine deacetylase